MIKEQALSYSVVSISNTIIDKINRLFIQNSMFLVNFTFLNKVNDKNLKNVILPTIIPICDGS